MAHILIVGGSTGREYAIVNALAASPQTQISVYQWAYNPFIEKKVSHYKVGNIRCIEEIVAFAKKLKVDFVIVGQGESIENGIGDRLFEEHISCVAPSKQLAQIEISKQFSLDLINKVAPQILPEYKSFKVFDPNAIKNYIKTFDSKFVCKRDGAINSRGVFIYKNTENDIAECLQVCDEWIGNGKSIILEEFIEGKELSLTTFTDGKDFLHAPPTRMYKQIFEKDQGENTSGMGAITTRKILPFMTEQQLIVLQHLNEKVIKALQKFGNIPYKGALFGEFMLTPKNGIKFIEYNARFGNPCTINHLQLLENDPAVFFEALAYQKLGTYDWRWKPCCSLSAYAVPKGYPYSKENVGKEIDVTKMNTDIFYALMNYSQQNTACFSRLFAISFTGDNLRELNEKMNTGMSQCNGEIHWRKDIGIFI